MRFSSNPHVFVLSTEGKFPGNYLNYKRMQLIKKWSRITENLPETAVSSITACLLYSIFSMTMTFTNKALFEFFHFEYPISLLMFQYVFTVFILTVAKFFGLINYTPLRWDIVQKWYPVNLLFICMLVSGSFALKMLSVPIVTIFKNVATATTALGDFVIFHQPISRGIVASVVLMVISSIVAGANDLAFDGIGYLWMFFNCASTAGYLLYMRHAMKQTSLDEWGMVFYNNFLAIPTVIPILLWSGELPLLAQKLDSFDGPFLWVILWSAISGFLLSMTSFWAVKTTSPTTYSIVGTLNKIPLTVLGIIFFSSPIRKLGLISIGIGLIAGTMYSIAKSRLARSQSLLPK